MSRVSGNCKELSRFATELGHQRFLGGAAVVSERIRPDREVTGTLHLPEILHCVRNDKVTGGIRG